MVPEERGLGRAPRASASGRAPLAPREGGSNRRPSAEEASSGPAARGTGRAVSPQFLIERNRLSRGCGWLLRRAVGGFAREPRPPNRAALGEPRPEGATQRAPEGDRQVCADAGVCAQIGAHLTAGA